MDLNQLVARGCAAIVLACALLPAYADDDELNSDLDEQIVKIPVVIQGLFTKSERSLTATIFHPDGDGPFPLVVLSHGTPVSAADLPKIGRYRKIEQINEFIKRGFAVIVPIRRGYGATGGDFAENLLRCDYASFRHAGLEAARDLIATIDYAKTLPFVQSNKIILAGQSTGGFSSLAAASLQPAGVIAVLNFSGGKGGDPVSHPGIPCGASNMGQVMASFGKSTQVPVLWHYVENDQFFGPDYAKAWFAAFQRAGGKGKLVMQPPFGSDGHGLFSSSSGIQLWTSEVDIFLKENALL